MSIGKIASKIGNPVNTGKASFSKGSYVYCGYIWVLMMATTGFTSLQKTRMMLFYSVPNGLVDLNE